MSEQEPIVSTLERFQESLERLLAAKDSTKISKLAVSCAASAEPEQRVAILRSAREALALLAAQPPIRYAVDVELLRAQPNDLALARELASGCRATGKARELVAVLDALVTGEAASGGDTLALRALLADLLLHVLGDKARAAEHIAALLMDEGLAVEWLPEAEALARMKPLFKVLAPSMAEVFRRMGRVGEEMSLLQHEVTSARPERLILVRRRLAELKLTVLDDPEGALEQLEALFATSPEDDAGRLSYLHLCQELGQAERALARLSQAAQSLSEPEAKARVGASWGKLAAELGDFAQASDALLLTLATQAADPVLLSAAHQLLTFDGLASRHRRQALLHILRHGSGLERAKAAAELLGTEAAQAEPAGALGVPAAAARALVGDFITLVPHSLCFHAALSQLLESAGDWDALEQELQRARGALEGLSVDDVTIRLALLWCTLGRGEEVSELALSLAANEGLTCLQLEPLAAAVRELELPEAYVAIETRLIHAQPDAASRAARGEALAEYLFTQDDAQAAGCEWLRYAAVALREANAIRESRELYERILQHFPDDLEAAAAAVELAALEGELQAFATGFDILLGHQPARAVGALVELVATQLGEEAVSPLLELVDRALWLPLTDHVELRSSLWRLRLNLLARTSARANAYEDALAAVEHLDEFDGVSGRLERLVTLASLAPAGAPVWSELERAAATAGQPERIPDALVAALLRQREPKSAVELAERLLEQADLLGVDEAVVEKGLRHLLSLAPASRFALDRLSVRLSQAGEVLTLLDFYDQAIAFTSESAELESLVEEAATLARDLRAPAERALSYLTQLARLRPADGKLQQQLGRQYRRLGKLDAWTRWLAARLASGEDFVQPGEFEEFAQLWVAAAAPAGQSCRLGQSGAPELELSGSVERRLLSRLVEQAAVVASLEAQVVLGVRLAELRPEPLSCAAALHAPARLALTELHRVEQARALLESALALSGEQLELLDLLVACLEQSQDSSALAAALLRRAALVSPEAARLDYARASALYEGVLGDRPAAIRSLELQSELEGTGPEVLERLGELCAAEGRYEDVALLLERRCLMVPESERRALLIELGTLRGERLHDARGALRAFAKARDYESVKRLVEMTPAEEQRDLVERCRRLGQRGAEMNQPGAVSLVVWANRRLASLLLNARLSEPSEDRQQTLAADALAMLEEAGKLTDQPESRRELQLDLARLQVEVGGDLPRALTMLSSLLDENSEDAVAELCFSRALALLDPSGAPGQLAAWYLRRAERPRAADAQTCQDFLAAARLLAPLAREAARVESCYRKAGELGSQEALEWLELAYGARGERRLRADALQSLTALLQGESRRRRVVELVDELLELGSTAEARGWLERELAQDYHLELAERLERLDESEGRFVDAARWLARRAELVTDREEVVSLLVRASQLCRRQQPGAPEVRVWLSRAGSLAPDDRSLQLELAEICEADGHLAEARDSLQAILRSLGTSRGHLAASVHQRLSRVMVGLGDEAGAVGELEAAVAAEPNSPELLDELSLLAFRQGNLSLASRMASTSLLIRRRQPRRAPSDLVAPNLVMGLCAERDGDSERAKDCFELARDAALEDEAAARLYLGHALTLGVDQLAASALALNWDSVGSAEQRVSLLRSVHRALHVVPTAALREDLLRRMAELSGLRAELSAKARLELGRLYSELGEREQAERQLEELLVALDAGLEASRELTVGVALQEMTVQSRRKSGLVRLSGAAQAGDLPESVHPALASLWLGLQPPESDPSAAALAFAAELAEHGFLEQALSGAPSERRQELALVSAIALRDLGQAPRASLQLQRALRDLLPEGQAALAWSLRLGIARELAKLGQLTDSLAWYERLLESGENKTPTARLSLLKEQAQLHLSLDQLVEAHEALGLAFRLEPRNCELALEYALVSYDLGYHDAADKACRLLVSQKSGLSESGEGLSSEVRSRAQQQLAFSMLLQGDLIGARRMVGRALDELPSNASAKRLRDSIA